MGFSKVNNVGIQSRGVVYSGKEWETLFLWLNILCVPKPHFEKCF